MQTASTSVMGSFEKHSKSLDEWLQPLVAGALAQVNYLTFAHTGTLITCSGLQEKKTEKGQGCLLGRRGSAEGGKDIEE